MNLFLIGFPPLLFFFLCSTAYSLEARDSIGLFVRGVAASFIVFLLLYLFRNLFPNQPGHILSLAYYWFYDFLLYLVVGVGVFCLVPSYRDAYNERSRRLESFLFGVFTLSGLVTLIWVPYQRDPYYVFMLPLLRVAVILLMSRLMHRVLSEYGARLGLMIAAAVCLSILPALIPFFHFWNLRLAALASFIIFIGACIFIDWNEIASIFNKELRAFREGKF
jgi:hypothetical protein